MPPKPAVSNLVAERVVYLMSNNKYVAAFDFELEPVLLPQKLYSRSLLIKCTQLIPFGLGFLIDNSQ